MPIVVKLPSSRPLGNEVVRGKEARDSGFLRANANRTEGLVKEGRHTWLVTLSRSEVLKPDGQSRFRSLRLKQKPEGDSN